MKMPKKKEIGLIMVKYPHAGEQDNTQRIIDFTKGKFLAYFKKEPEIIYEKLIIDGTKIFEDLYSDLRGKWEDVDEMLNDFKTKPVHPFIFAGPVGTRNLLKLITGKTEREDNPETIRGMMRALYGNPKKEWFNSVHVPHSHETEGNLQILEKYGFLSIPWKELIK